MKPGLMDDLPEAVAGMRKVKTGMRRGFARVDAAEQHLQIGRDDVADVVIAHAVTKPARNLTA
ncbi:hypothetical protein E05_34600 [Plautia stali symbiont]|nr:hypothetical protein E05_34600 [Plautia stali symbiont]